MANYIEPCPSCQSRSIHVAEWYSGTGEVEFYCVCDGCGYEDPDKFSDEFLAVDHWNRRVANGFLGGEDPTDTVYDRLEEDDWSGRSAYDEFHAYDEPPASELRPPRPGNRPKKLAG